MTRELCWIGVVIVKKSICMAADGTDVIFKYSNIQNNAFLIWYRCAGLL